MSDPSRAGLLLPAETEEEAEDVLNAFDADDD
jgi:hypothetical protein